MLNRESGYVVLGQSARGEEVGAVLLISEVAHPALREDHGPVATTAAHAPGLGVTAHALRATARLTALAARELDELFRVEVPAEQPDGSGYVAAATGP